MGNQERRPTLGYMPALDGLRALGLVAVLLFHSAFSWAKGGFLGVTAFFVLSGFLITSLLLVERNGTGSINLKSFWARRARRLAPGMVILVGMVAVLYIIAPLRSSNGVVTDGASALAWVSNWRFIIGNRAYSQLFTQPSPFGHTWSLGIEEQFYVVLALLAVLFVGGRRKHRGWLAVTVVGGIVVSTVLAAAFHAPGGATGRSYYGTDTRLAEPLVGVLLALLLVGRRGVRQLTPPGRRLAGTLGIVGLAGLSYLVVTESQYANSLYRGGFLVAALLAAGVVAGASQKGTLVARALSAQPLVLLGRISYGCYLYHWPVFLWLTAKHTGFDGFRLLVLRTSVTVALATFSYVVVERPIRIGGVVRGQLALVGWADAAVASLAALLLVISVPAGASTLIATGAHLRAPSKSKSTAARPATAPSPTTTVPRGRVAAANTVTSLASRLASSSQASVTKKAKGTTSPTTPPETPGDAAPALKVAVVGDSMADGLAPGLDHWAKSRGDVVVYDLAVRACPISRGGTRRFPDDTPFPLSGDCGWWNDPSNVRWQALSEWQPDVIVVQDGMNEVPDRKLDDWADWRWPGEPQFDSWLLNEYSTAFRKLTSVSGGQAKVLFLNAACADWSLMEGSWKGFDNGVGDARIGALNRTAQAIAVTGATTADFDTHLCPNGQYSSTVDGVANGRPDGYHLSEAASEAIADKWLGPLVLAETSGKHTTL